MAKSVKVERNIVKCRELFKVMVMRDGVCRYASANTLKKAVALRDEIEKQYPASIPWEKTERCAAVRHTAVIRNERKKAGLCIYCGDNTHRNHRVDCVDCAKVRATKNLIGRDLE
jgi:hypothetical protein